MVEHNTQLNESAVAVRAPGEWWVPEPDLGPGRSLDGQEGALGRRPSLPDGKAVHVWAASLDVPVSVLEGFKKTLSRDELERAARFHFSQHRNRYIVARGWLRQLLGGYLSIPAETLKFDYGPRGKPALAAASKASGLQFNLAHSEGLSLITVAQAVSVGIDVERVRTLPDADELVARFFSKRENSEFKLLPEDQKPAAFFNLWTRKEAWLKATGEGIAHLLSRVEVSFVPGVPARLLSLPDPFGAVSTWSLCDLAPGPGLAAALAVAAGDARPLCRQWDHERVSLFL